MPRNDTYFGWRVVGVAFVISMFCLTMGNLGPSIILPILHSTRGWNISTISAAVTVHFLVGALATVYLPVAHALLGLARATCAGVALSGIGLWLWSLALAPWQLFAAAFVSGLGFALVGHAAVNAMISRWFDRDRPKALSLALNGISIGGVVLVPLSVHLIGIAGFTSFAALTALSVMVVLCPLTLYYLSPRPADFGVGLDGLAPTATLPQPTTPPLTRAELLRDRHFLWLSAAFATALFAQTGVLAHLISRLTPEFGLGLAAASISVAGICSTLGRTLLGWLIGEADRRRAAAVNFVMQGAGVLLLAFGSGAPALALGCILFGLGLGNHPLLQPLIAQREFRREDVAVAVALLVAINQAVASVSPAILGALRDATGSYTASFLIGSAAFMAASLIIARRRPPGFTTTVETRNR